MALRILFAGTPGPAAQVLTRLLAAGVDVTGVLTRADAVGGRGQRARRCEVAVAATQAGLDVFQPTSLRGPQVQAWVHASQADAVVVVAYGLMIPAHLLSIPRHGWLNLHFSLLPAWRGAAPVQRAIQAGDEITGATVFRIEEGLDTGPVLGHVTQPIAPADNAGTLLAALCTSGSDLLLHVLAGLDAGTLTAQPQQHERATWAPRVTSAEARINWQAPALVISRHIRAFTPAPGAWTMVGDARIKIAGVPSIQPDSTLLPGQCRVSSTTVLVGTGSVDLALDVVQPAGKAVMRAADWARGLRSETPVFT